eukprot:CAMPEP_0118671908 /NCGR_PEP_ID=MMETSP0785-20121206/22253_1 /TAXON_ID=91992 /ORGANISM="Bolidomonas pacifica, Strain CCMP 1866" /LENGTH=1080 /DNA_ID=CAMNT_0006566825 /DNA_START=102 /DNA_END=3342 /DNA_ORIENTATION=+
MSQIVALELRPSHRLVNAVSIYPCAIEASNNNNTRDIFRVAYTSQDDNDRYLFEVRTFEIQKKRSGNSNNPFADDDDDDDDDDLDSLGGSKDRTYSRESNASSIFDSFEPLPPNSKHSIWASVKLSLSAPPSSIHTLPSLPSSSSAASNLSTFSAAVSDRYLCNTSKNGILFLAGEGTHNAVRLFPESKNDSDDSSKMRKGITISTSDGISFYGYNSELRGVLELCHPSDRDLNRPLQFFNSSSPTSSPPTVMEVVGDIAVVGSKGIFRAYTKGRKGIMSPTSNEGKIFDFGDSGAKGRGNIVNVTPMSSGSSANSFNQRKSASVFLSCYKSMVVVKVGWNEGEQAAEASLGNSSAASFISPSTKRPLLSLLLSSKTVMIVDSLCLSVPLTTISLDPAPFFDISSVLSSSPLLIVTASDGEARCILPSSLDSRSSEVERCLKLAIDAMGRTGWPLAQFSEALGVSYAAASYEGEGVGASLPDLLSYTATVTGISVGDEDGETSSSSKKKRPRHSVAMNALLCLACASLSAMDDKEEEIPKVALVAAKQAPTANPSSPTYAATQKVCQEVAKLLLSTGSASKGALTEAAFHLFGHAGLYRDAMDTLDSLHSLWTKYKFESFACSYLADLWETGDHETCMHVMDKSRGIFLTNPGAALGIFTRTTEKTLSHVIEPLKVCSFFKTLTLPDGVMDPDATELPLNVGNSLAAQYLIKAIGLDDEEVAKAHSSTPSQSVASVHDQLCLILLEGIIGEVGEDFGEIPPTAMVYKRRLHQVLKWKYCQYNPITLMDYLPDSFRIEKALLLGKMDNPREAIDLLYSENNLTEALEFCDTQHAILTKSTQAEIDPDDSIAVPESTCAYLPLVEAALDNDCVDDAIQVMVSRREVIDQGAALRALPPDTPIQALKNFLVPSLKSNASKLRQLSVAANLIRARQQELQKLKLSTNLFAQSTLESVIELKGWKLGMKKGESGPMKVQHNLQHSNQFPFAVELTKHFFKRHVVLQAKISNKGDVKIYDCAFNVAEVSDDVLMPSVLCPIPLLPSGSSSCSFSVLERRAQAMDPVVLTTELRWTRGDESVQEDMQ